MTHTKEKRALVTRVRVEQRSTAKIINDYSPPPALGCSDELFAELQAATEPVPAAGEWAARANKISHALRINGPDGFLRLPPIARTMHLPEFSLARRYLTYLSRSRQFTPTLHKALTESPVGKPLVNPHYPLSSPLLIQHGYHLVRLLETTDFELAKLRLVVEFGGGYGSFFRLLRNLDYRNRYVICDLPVMCALQRFYLRNVFPTGSGANAPSNLNWLKSDMRDSIQQETLKQAPSLFVATWSLSETPPAVRSHISPALSGFSYILCVYQRSFCGYNNLQYFKSLERELPQFKWHHAECPLYKNNFYLIGQNTTLSNPA